MRTLPSDAQAQIAAAFRKGRVLVHLTATEPDRPSTVYRWASRALTLSGNAYTDALSRKPSFGWRTAKAHGGLFEEGDCTLYLRNESGRAPALLGQYYPGGDKVEVFVLFVTGSETSASLVRIFVGVAGEPEFTRTEWELRCRGNATADFREIPSRRVNLKSHPYAALDAVGKPIPLILGDHTGEELIDESYVQDLYPLHLIDRFQGIYLGGQSMDAQGPPFLQYPQAAKVVQVRAGSYSGDPVAGTLTITGTQRTATLYPALPVSTNDVTDWRRAANRVLSSGAQLVDGSNLDLFIEEVPRLGEAFSTALEIEVEANAATYDLTLLRFGETVYTASGLTGNVVVPLLGLDLAVTELNSTQTISSDRADTGIVRIDPAATITVDPGATWSILNGSNFADTWGGWAVYLDGHGDKLVYRIALVVHFNEQQTGDLTSLKAFAQGRGRRGDQGLYDGSTIAAASLRNGADQLHYLLRARDLYALPAARVDGAAFAQAALGARAGWHTKVALTQAVDPEDFADELAYMLGSHLVYTLDEDWRLVPRDASAAAVWAFLETQHLAVRRVDPTTGTIQEEGADARVGQLGADNALNDLLVRYGPYGPTGDFQAAAEKTARWWATGTATLNDAAHTLTDTGTDFVQAQIAVGHTVVLGPYEYTVEAVAQTVLTLDRGPGSGTPTYFVGPNLSATLVHARRRYGRENTLTRSGGGAARDGGLTARYVDFELAADPEDGLRPADRFVAYAEAWFSQAWTRVEVTAFMRALALELGDRVLLDYRDLPTHKAKRPHGAVAEAIDGSETVWDVGTGRGYSYRAGEYLLIDAEVVLVEGVAADAITVARGQCGTTAATHTTSTVLYLLPIKWEVVGIRPDLDRWQLRYRLQEAPVAVESAWIESTTRTVSADEATWGPVSIPPDVTVTVDAAATWTVMAA